MPEPIKDVTNADPNPPAANADGTKSAPVVADADAAEIGRIMLDSGYTKDQINDVLQAPRALEALRYMVKNDPKEFIRSLERTDPGAGENFLDKTSELYVERYDRSGAPDGKTANGDGKEPATGELFDKVRRLTEEVTAFKTEAQARAAAAADAATAQRYMARVDDLFNQLPADKFPLADYEKGLIKDALSSRLAADPTVVQRVKNGNFVDVPRTFQSIIDNIGKGRQAKADAETKARERASLSMFPTFEGGPMELPKEFMSVPDTTNVDDIWNVDGLVKALNATGR